MKLEAKKWKCLIACFFWLVAFVLGPVLLISPSFGADSQQVIIDNAYNKIINVFYKTCSWASIENSCMWGASEVGLFIQGTDLTAIFNIRNSTSGVLGWSTDKTWSWNGANFSHASGWGGRYSCNACTCSMVGGMMFGDVYSTMAGTPPECNNSPSGTVYPLETYPERVAVCATYGDEYYLAKYTYSMGKDGVVTASGNNYTCNYISGWQLV